MGFLDSRIKVLPNGREVLQMPNSVNFAIVTYDNYLLLAKQFRASNEKETSNLFGGYIENDETWTNTLYREMKEEANIEVEDVCDIETVFENKYVSMGYTSERNTTCIVYLNKKLSDLKLQCNDEDKNITITHYYLSKYTLSELSKETEGLKMFLVLKQLSRYVY